MENIIRICCQEVVVNFKLSEEALAEPSELEGIQKYQIFKYFEDDNMLLPIITEYN